MMVELSRCDDLTPRFSGVVEVFEHYFGPLLRGPGHRSAMSLPSINCLPIENLQLHAASPVEFVNLWSKGEIEHDFG